MKIKFIYIFLICICFLSLSRSEGQAQTDLKVQPFVVVELFTSQGCSSTPQANKLLTVIDSLSKDSNRLIIPLSYHVDYWDYLGWKDPYSSRYSTERQYQYVRAFNQESAYTPQIIVNGRDVIDGGSYSSLLKDINQHFQEKPEISISLNLITKDVKNAKIGYSLGREASSYLIQAVLVERKVTNYIPKGENAGNTFTHVNVVRSLGLLQPVREGEFDVSLISSSSLESKMAVVVLVQNPSTMQIVGANILEL